MARTRTGKSFRRSGIYSAALNVADSVARAAYRATVTDAKKRAFNAFKNAVSSRMSKRQKTETSRLPKTSSYRKRRVPVWRTTGVVGPKFSKKGSSALSKYLRHGICIKKEQGATLADSSAVYVGHHTMPANIIMKGVFYALARKILAFNNAFPAHSEEPALDFPVDVSCTYRVTVDGPLLISTPLTVSSPVTIESLGKALGNNVLSTMGPDTFYETTSITVLNVDDPLNPIRIFYMPTVNISIELDVVSNLQIQNRTLASVGAADESSILDVANNPLRGKIYHGFSNKHSYRYNNDFVGVTPTFYHGASDGLLFIGPDNGTFTTEMSQTIRKPPPRSAFGNVTSTGYVRLKPGEIRRSKLRDFKMKTLNQWLMLYFDCMRGSPTVIDILTEAYVKEGKSCFLGLEKMCDSELEANPISVGFEVIVSANFLAHIQKHSYMNPLVLT